MIRIAPSLNIPKRDLDKGLEIIEDSIRDTLSGVVPNKVVEYMRRW